MTRGLRFLLGLPPGTSWPAQRHHLLGYAIAMLLVFGLAFELPLLVLMLNSPACSPTSGSPSGAG